MIAIIPARKNSQRIPGKNKKDFRGKPIIAYSIETAKESGLFDEIYVSSDDAEIGRIAHDYGVRFYHRSDRMSVNEVGTQAVAKDLLGVLGFGPEDIACVIYPTAPLMSVEDLLYGARVFDTNPLCHYAYSIGTKPLHDAGQFYFGEVGAFFQEEPIFSEHSITIPIDSSRVCDINTPEDWERCEQMYDLLRRNHE